MPLSGVQETNSRLGWAIWLTTFSQMPVSGFHCQQLFQKNCPPQRSPELSTVWSWQLPNRWGSGQDTLEEGRYNSAVVISGRPPPVIRTPSGKRIYTKVFKKLTSFYSKVIIFWLTRLVTEDLEDKQQAELSCHVEPSHHEDSRNPLNTLKMKSHMS